MAQQQQTHSPRRIVTYHTAKWAWIITAWIWITIIIAFLVQFVPNLLTLPDAATSMKSTWTAVAMDWLVTPNPIPVEDSLRVMALIVALLLVVIPPLAFGLKQALRDVEQDRLREDFDKLIDVLQQDSIWLQTEILQEQLQRQIQKQEACVKALMRIYTLLQQNPTSSGLQAAQKEFSHILQDIQERTTEQVQRLSTVYEQDKQAQNKSSASLENISLLLEQMRDSLRTLSSLSHQEDESLPNQETITEPVQEDATL